MKVSAEFNKYALSDDLAEKKKIQTTQMCILRNDFMIDQPSNSVKLVEYNTIASSFGILSQKVGQVQEYIKHKYSDDIKYNYSRMETAEDQEVLDFANTKMHSFSDNMISHFNTAIQKYKASMSEKFQT